MAVGMKGNTIVRFDIEITDGSTVEKTIDFSAEELRVKVTRNGEHSDAVYSVRVSSTGETAANAGVQALLNDSYSGSFII